jgi:hypothetical protein
MFLLMLSVYKDFLPPLLSCLPPGHNRILPGGQKQKQGGQKISAPAKINPAHATGGSYAWILISWQSWNIQSILVYSINLLLRVEAMHGY